MTDTRCRISNDTRPRGPAIQRITRRQQSEQAAMLDGFDDCRCLDALVVDCLLIVVITHCVGIANKKVCDI
jgi:hypothetical protein